MTRWTGRRRYVAVATLVLLGYVIVAALLFAGRDFDRGPLSLDAPDAGAVPAGVTSATAALAACFPDRSGIRFRFRVVSAPVDGEWYHACYQVSVTTGRLTDLRVVDADGFPVTDVPVLKRAGVWPLVGVVTTGWHLLAGFAALLGVTVLGFWYYSAARPGPPPRPAAGWTWYQRPWIYLSLVFLPVWSWIGLARTRSVSRARKIRVLIQAVFLTTWLVVLSLVQSATAVSDPWALFVAGALAAGLVLSTTGGWRWLAHPDFDHPDGMPSRAGAGPSEQPPEPLWPSEGRPPPVPRPIDVAVREFRAAARSRAVASTAARLVAIAAAAVAAFGIGTVVALMGTDLGTDGAMRVFVNVALILYFYAIFFVVPAAVAALLGVPLILGWRDPARILLLRPFNRADHSQPLRAMVRREVAGYGHAYTLADAAIKVRWFVAVPVLLGQLGFLSFRLRRITGPGELERLEGALGHVRRRNLNWVVSRSKVFAVRCSDDVWQQAVDHVARSCDLVIVDLTDLTDNLAWELDLLRDLGRLDDCIFLARHGTEARAATMAAVQVRRPVRLLGYDAAGRLLAPREFRNTLSAILFRTTGAR